MNIRKNKKGNTLIETIIYTALLAILMIGVFSSVYMIIDLEQRKIDKNYEKEK